MKIQCQCGELIPDITDQQNNKAYFIPDELWEGVMESIYKNKSPWDATRESKRQMLQCYECSRIYIEGKDGEYISFKPEGNIDFGILNNT